MKNLKILILGSSNVGKTSLLHQIVFGPKVLMSCQVQPTIEDVYFATYDLLQNEKNQSIKDDRILFFDVAGVRQSIDIELLKNYISFADEFVLVYSITDRSSFNLVDTIKKLIDQCRGKRDHPIIVLGNKVDLDMERQVSFDEALVWAKRENIKLFEVSSFERGTLLDFSKYLANQHLTSQSHSSSTFKLLRTKTYQSSTGP